MSKGMYMYNNTGIGLWRVLANTESQLPSKLNIAYRLLEEIYPLHVAEALAHCIHQMLLCRVHLVDLFYHLQTAG